MRYIAGLLLCLSMALADEMVQVVEPATPITKRVMLLVDVSGSMASKDRVPRSLAAIREITQQPIDDMELAVIAFTDSTTRWQGIKEENLAPGWARLPSADAVTQSQTWLEEHGASGDTSFLGAFEAAIKEPVKDLTIILVSDGLTVFKGEPGSVFTAVAGGQAWRVRQGHGKAVIYALLLDDCYWARDLVKANGGGAYQLRQESVPPEPRFGPH